VTKDVEFERLSDIELPAELDAKVTKMIEEADREDIEARVNFRWGKAQVDLVKRAAEAMGVPYQTYIKQVVFRQAVADLNAARGAIATLAPSS
jgi:predicted DNA binding CopG/RHH family protein